MKKPNFELANGPIDAKWLKETLYPWDRGDFLRLGSVIPKGFKSYISIRHEKSGEDPVYYKHINYEKLNLILADYTEDSSCDTDMNVVMTGAGNFVEVQGTAEGVPFSRKEMDALLSLAEDGIRELTRLQNEALKA